VELKEKRREGEYNTSKFSQVSPYRERPARTAPGKEKESPRHEHKDTSEGGDLTELQSGKNGDKSDAVSTKRMRYEERGKSLAKGR